VRNFQDAGRLRELQLGLRSSRRRHRWSGLPPERDWRSELDEANPEWWSISDGKLYIFAKAAGPSRFQQDLAGNVAKANEKRGLILKR